MGDRPDCLDCRGKFGAIVFDWRCEQCGCLFRLRELLLSDRFPADGQPVLEPLIRRSYHTALEVSDSYLRNLPERLSKEELRVAKAETLEPEAPATAAKALPSPPKAKREEGGDARKSSQGKRKERRQSSSQSREKKRHPKKEAKRSRSGRGRKRSRERPSPVEVYDDLCEDVKEEPESEEEARKKKGSGERSRRARSVTPKSRGEKKDDGKSRSVRQRSREASREEGEERHNEARGSRPREPSRPPPDRREGGSHKWEGPIPAYRKTRDNFREHPDWDPKAKFTNKGSKKREQQERRRQEKGKGKSKGGKGHQKEQWRRK